MYTNSNFSVVNTLLTRTCSNWCALLCIMSLEIDLYVSLVISCFLVGYREIAVKIFFDLTLVAPVKILISMFLLPKLIMRASQPDGNMTLFTLHLT